MSCTPRALVVVSLLCLPAIAACGSSDDGSAPSAGGQGGSQQGADAGEEASQNDDGSGPDVTTEDTGADVTTEDTAQFDAQESPDAGLDVTLTDSAPPVDPHPDCTRLAALDALVAAASGETERVALIDQFVLDVVASDGFPIRCGGAATFLFERPQGFATPSVVGDFNSWDPAAGPMAPMAGNWFRADLTVDAAPARFLYKVTDGQSWVADPNARRFGYDQYGEYSLVSGGLTQGHLERHRGVAGAGLAPRDLTLYLPPGYEASSASYPVLYAHDGQNLFDPNAAWGGWRLDESVESLLSQNAVQPFIVVGIHNTAERMDEYTHVPDVFSGQTVGGKGEAYFNLILTRIMPLVSSHYRVRTGPENTWTMGSSLGGLISLYFGMKHPDVFGRVAGLSSTSGWGSIGAHNQTIIELLPTVTKPSVVFYLDSGGSDGGGAGCVDSDSDGIFDDAPAAADNYCENLQMRDVFLAQGYTDGVDLFHWWEPNAEHNEAAWAARLNLPLEVLAAQ